MLVTEAHHSGLSVELGRKVLEEGASALSEGLLLAVQARMSVRKP